MKNVPSRIKFDHPPAVQEVQTDDDIIKKCLMNSKLYQSNVSINSNHVNNSIIEENINIDVKSYIKNNSQALKYFRLNNYKKY